MLFNSFAYLCVFLPVVVAVYWALIRTHRVTASIVWLAAASYFFYVSGEKLYPWMLAASVVMNFGIGLAIARLKAGDEKGQRATAMMALGVVLNLALLAFYKYASFVSVQLHGAGLPTPVLDIVLPIGISFFTFTQIAYLVDVRQGKASESDFASYLLFVSYFPHLIAGPILHHGEMLPQFRNPVTKDVARNIAAGLLIFAIGLAKKTLLADPSGAIATSVFGDAAAAPPGFFVAWLGAVAYAMQIYFDFSGYSDMAIGASAMLGIKLPINFNSPYKAVSIIDFWRRWHITLSRFLRDYLYIPLGGNRKGTARRYANLLTTMVLGGIWHGAGWMFIIWGAMHGVAQALAHGWNDLGKRVKLPKVPPLLGWAATFVFVTVAWVPFRATTFEQLSHMWRGMAGLGGFAMIGIGPLRTLGETLGLGAVDVGFSAFSLPALAVGFFVAVLAPNSQQLLRRFNVGLDSHGYDAHGAPSRFAARLDWRWIVFAGVMLGLAARAIGGYSEFIYFQF